jgi:hypothetical protein
MLICRWLLEVVACALFAATCSRDQSVRCHDDCVAPRVRPIHEHVRGTTRDWLPARDQDPALLLSVHINTTVTREGRVLRHQDHRTTLLRMLRSDLPLGQLTTAGNAK